MAYNIRYFIPYRRQSGGYTYIHILEKDTSTGTYQTLQADGNPLEITFSGDVNDLYCGTVGSGADINLRVDPLTLTNLFTTDPQKFMVKIFNGGSLMWQGFISTGIYSEELNNHKNQIITLKANDGMAVLDMIPYRPDSSSYYTGSTYVGNVFNNIFGKLNLAFDNAWGLMDYRVVDYSDNPFLYLGVNQENYIDESGKVMTCREVLDSIMRSFGVRMSFRGSYIYIIDPLIMHDLTKGQLFAMNWGESIQTFPGGYLDISLGQISWYQTGISMDIIPPINQLEIKYDPYTLTSVEYNFADSNNWSNSGSWSGPYGSSGPNKYYINNSLQYANILTDGSILKQAIKREDGTDQEYYLKIQHNSHTSAGSPGIARISFPLSSVYTDSNLYLKITADYYCNTRGYDNIYDTSIVSDEINYIETSIGYSIGGGPDTSIHWQNIRVLSDYTLNGATIGESDIADRWVTSYNFWPYGGLEQLTGDGSIFVYIYGRYTTGWYTTTDKNVLVKNVRAEIVNENGDIIENSGQKFTALKPLNNYVITPTEVQLIQGTGPYGSSKGAYIDILRKIISPGIYRGLDPGTGTLYPMAYHVAQSYVSQYGSPRFVLKGDLNVKDHLIDTQNYLIKWSSRPQLQGKSFFIANGTYNDRYEYMSVEMVECASTRDNINIL
jgi:hypothetical protein